MSAANGYVVSDSEDIDSSMSGVIKPPDIEQDLKGMERRKRVDMVINSQLFREELERIIESQINEGYAPSSLSALQQVTELLLPSSARNSSLTRIGSSAIPINDIRGVDAFNYDKGEKLLRCKLASVYRLVDLYGWSQSIYNHISVRVNQDHEHFLLNPFGLQYHEVTASSLLKVDMQGNLVNPGSTNFGFNRAGWVLHSAIHSARPDIKAIIHIHHPTCVAISSMKCGLLKISQEAAIIGDVSYHDFRGIVVDTEEREIIARNLGPFNKVLLLRNHGAIACGETIEEALHLMHNLVIACETQAKLIHVGVDNIHQMSKEAVDQVRSIVKMAVSQVHGKPEDTETKVKQTGDEDTKDRPRKWKVWDLEFEAQMRMLDNAGFRTGYLYRQPLLRADQQRIKYDVEIPPAATSLHQYFEGDKWLSPLKKLVDGKKTQDKLKWVNSPNSYQKVEIPESGTQDPKKITKWVQDSSPPHGNPVKIENAHQFVPVVADPTEFRRKQKEMKQIRMDNKISGGPQSHILEGVTWEDVGHKPAENDQVVLVGAASKGIIQREYQHNAKVYKSAYAKNPFDDVSDKELEEYKEYVARKQRGEPVDDVPERFRHLLLEPVPEHLTDGRMNQQRSLDDQITSPTEDTEETSEEGQLTPAPRSFLKRLLRKSMRSSPHHDKEKDHHEKDVVHHQEDAHHEKEEEKKEERKEEKKKDKEHREKEKEKEKHHENKKEKKSRKRQDKSRSDKAHAEKAR